MLVERLRSQKLVILALVRRVKMKVTGKYKCAKGVREITIPRIVVSQESDISSNSNLIPSFSQTELRSTQGRGPVLGHMAGKEMSQK